MNLFRWLKLEPTPNPDVLVLESELRVAKRELQFRPWCSDPALTAEQKRIIKRLLSAPRADQRAADKLLRERAEKRRRG